MKLRRAWFDASVRPEAVGWFELRDGLTNRYLGMFTELSDARAFVRRRPPTQTFYLIFRHNGRTAARMFCWSMFGGCGIKSKGEILGRD